MFRRTTRIGHVSHIAARLDQSASIGNVPRVRSFDFAAFAAATLNRFQVDPAQQEVKTLIKRVIGRSTRISPARAFAPECREAPRQSLSLGEKSKTQTKPWTPNLSPSTGRGSTVRPR